MTEEKRDYHIHSNFSDGYLSPEQVCQVAINKRVSEICITDHYSTWKHALQPQDLETYFSTLKELQKKRRNEIKLFIGIEVDLSSIKDLWELLNFEWDLILFEYTFQLPVDSVSPSSYRLIG